MRVKLRCRPPEADSFFKLLLLLFIDFYFSYPFLPEPLDMMGELVFGAERGLEWAVFLGGRWDGVQRWLAEEDWEQRKERKGKRGVGLQEGDESRRRGDLARGRKNRTKEASAGARMMVRCPGMHSFPIWLVYMHFTDSHVCMIVSGIHWSLN